MKRLRFVMIGGFLGAGKTTTISPAGPPLHGPRAARRAGHQRPGPGPRRHQQPAGPGFPGRGSGRRLLLLPLRRPGRQGGPPAEERTSRRDPGRAGRQLHRPGGHGRAAACGTCTASASRSPRTRSCSSRATGCASCATRQAPASRPRRPTSSASSSKRPTPSSSTASTRWPPPC